MFLNREDTSVHTSVHTSIPGPSAQALLREDLRQRLRLVAEFATLGAYELMDSTGPHGHEDAPHAREREATRRVFLFTRVSESKCSHSPEAPESCPATGAARIARHARPAARRRVARRRGGVETSQQPCTVSAVEMATGRPAR